MQGSQGMQGEQAQHGMQHTQALTTTCSGGGNVYRIHVTLAAMKAEQKPIMAGQLQVHS